MIIDQQGALKTIFNETKSNAFNVFAIPCGYSFSRYYSLQFLSEIRQAGIKCFFNSAKDGCNQYCG